MFNCKHKNFITARPVLVTSIAHNVSIYCTGCAVVGRRPVYNSKVKDRILRTMKFKYYKDWQCKYTAVPLGKDKGKGGFV